MWSGLCRGMTRTLLGTLLNGRPLDGQDRRDRRRGAEPRGACAGSRHAYPGLIVVPRAARTSSRRYGAALLGEAGTERAWRSLARRDRPRDQAGNGRLRLAAHPGEVDVPVLRDAEELRSTPTTTRSASRAGPTADRSAAYLGIDIGSTSTKLVADRRGRATCVVDIYRKTAGDPDRRDRSCSSARCATLAERQGRRARDPRRRAPPAAAARSSARSSAPTPSSTRSRAHVAGAVHVDPDDRHHLRDRRPGLEVHARRRRPHPRRQHELRLRRRHRLVRRGAGQQARLHGGGGGPAVLGLHAAARLRSLHRLHGAGRRRGSSRPAPRREEALAARHGLGGQELPQQGGRQPPPQPQARSSSRARPRATRRWSRPSSACSTSRWWSRPTAT